MGASVAGADILTAPSNRCTGMGNALSNTVEWVATCGASANRDVVVIVDPISTGAVLASQAVQQGLAIIAVWSESVPDDLKGFVDKRLSVRYIGVVQHAEGKLKATARAVRAISGERLKGVIVGCETGVLLGDALAEELGQRGNGTKLSPLRRNKWLQTEAVRESGANACIQSLVTDMAQVATGGCCFVSTPVCSPYAWMHTQTCDPRAYRRVCTRHRSSASSRAGP